MDQANAADGLARVQSESRIPASTWRQWCAQLELDPATAVELWDGVCHPLMVSSGQAPDLALAMQLRAARPDLYIDDFREELPAVLLSTALLDGLKSEALGITRTRGSLLRLYRHLGEQAGDGAVGRSFVRHVAGLTLLAAVLPDEFSLPRLVKVIGSGRGDLDGLIRLARKSLGDDDYGHAIAEAFDALQALDAPEPTAVVATDEGSATDDEAPTDEGSATDDGGLTDAGAQDAPSTPEDSISPDPYGRFLSAVRSALSAVFEVQEDTVTGEPREQAERLELIQGFEPFAGRIPSMEEAHQMSPAGAKGIKRRGPIGMSAGGGGGGGGGSRAPRPVLTARRTGGGGTVVSAAGGAPSHDRGASVVSSAPKTDSTRDDQPAEPPAPVPGPDGKLAAPMLHRNQLDDAVGHVAFGLGRARELDPRVWQLIVEPESELADPRELAEALATVDSAAERAAAGLRIAAQQQRVQTLLSVPADQRLQARRFDLEAEAFLNTMANNRRGFEPDSRQLIPLPNMLDHAAAALLRVEALRASVDAVREADNAGEVTAEVVTSRFENLLSEIAYLANRDAVRAARPQADADVAAVLAAVAADLWIDRVRGAALDYVGGLVEAGACDSMEALTAALEDTPLTLAAPGEGESAGEFPEELARDTALGEVVDALRVTVLRGVWSALQPAHRPAETTTRLDTDLRRVLRRCARITPRRERHQKNPKVALPATSLEKLSGNPALAHLFVRLTTDGRLLFVEDYEDGSYIDVFERKESKKRQMHNRARDRARAANTGELQTGSSYLHSVGRTKDPFGRTEREIMAACVKDDEDQPVIFEIF